MTVRRKYRLTKEKIISLIKHTVRIAYAAAVFTLVFIAITALV